MRRTTSSARPTSSSTTRRNRLAKDLFAVTISLLAVGCVSPGAYAATITVDVLGDAFAADGSCTLREAIQNANDDAGTNSDCAQGSGDDQIVFAVNGSIELTLGQLTIEDATVSGSLSIAGPGAELLTVAGGGLDRVFLNLFGANTVISGVTIADGWAGLDHGGGIYNSGQLMLENAIVSNNLGGSEHIGGGIFNDGGTLTVNGSTFSGNAACSGGAIGSVGGMLLVDGSTIDNNSAFGGGQAAGGGIYSMSGVATVYNSTVSNNGSTDRGAGIFNDFGEMTVNNSTVSGNLTSGSIGGIEDRGGVTTVVGSTVVGNGFIGIGGEVTLANTIVAGSEIYDAASAADSLGYNLIGAALEAGSAAPGDQVGTTASPIDPVLGPLQDNGGPTRTHALLSGSPAIDAGSNALIPAGTATDQRGFLRVVDGTVDIGAFESGNRIAVTVDIKPGSDRNPVNPRARGVLPVAVLSDGGFDALQVDYATVAFGASGAAPVRVGRATDVDGDGDADLVMHFRMTETGITCGDAEVSLTARTYGGQAVAGSDSIVTVSCR